MKESFFRESLALLKEVRRDLSYDAEGRATEKLDEVIERMQQALDDGSYRRISTRELLDALNLIVAASGPIASLIDTLLKRFP